MDISSLLTIFLVVWAKVSNQDLVHAQSNLNSKTHFSKELHSYKFRRPNKEYWKIYAYIRKFYPQVSKKDAKDIASYLIEYSYKENIDPKLVAALISQESSFNKKAISSTGAKGLGQIKTFNFKDLNIKNPYDIKQNVRGTVKYIKSLMSLWENEQNSAELALASYYQGPNAIKHKEKKLDSDASRYVQGIISKYNKFKLIK